MSCEHPLLAIDLYTRPEDKKHVIKILPRRHGDNVKELERRVGKENILALPCGKCASCKAAHKSEWAVRCMLESKLHKDNCFVTLTYDNNHLPDKLCKLDLRKFIKGIRNKGYKCRFFGCGEYGSQSGRPHYHVILFGFCPDDLKPFSVSPSGEMTYTSKLLSSIWDKGHVLVGNVTEGSCAYVAGYVDKKLNDEDGFILMSNRPGIAAVWFMENLPFIYKHDNIVLPGGHVVSPPRYCDILAERSGLELDEIRANRYRLSNNNAQYQMLVHKLDHVEKLWMKKGVEMKDKLRRLKRGL